MLAFCTGSNLRLHDAGLPQSCRTRMLLHVQGFTPGKTCTTPASCGVAGNLTLGAQLMLAHIEPPVNSCHPESWGIFAILGSADCAVHVRRNLGGCAYSGLRVRRGVRLVDTATGHLIITFPMHAVQVTIAHPTMPHQASSSAASQTGERTTGIPLAVIKPNNPVLALST